MKIFLDAKFANTHFVCNYNHSNLSLLYNYKNLKQIYFGRDFYLASQYKCIYPQVENKVNYKDLI